MAGVAWRGVRGVRPYLYPLRRKLHDDLALNLAREIRGGRRRAPAGAAAARGRCRHPCDGAHYYCAQLAGVLRARATKIGAHAHRRAARQSRGRLARRRGTPAPSEPHLRLGTLAQLAVRRRVEWHQPVAS